MDANENDCEEALAASRATTQTLLKERAARDEFLMTLVHELRNPITALTGALEIIKDATANHLSDKEREFLKIADVSVARLNQMLDEMLELLALEGREIELHYEPADVIALAREVLAEYEPRARVFEVTLNPVVGPESLRVECDAEKVRRVISNLVSNAIKYNRPGGEVTVSVREGDGFVDVAVADTGIGIPAEDHPKVFQRFYRAAAARQKGIVGTGLGLAIANHIVQMHGGEISFTSELGKGTTFKFTLPLRRPENANDVNDNR